MKNRPIGKKSYGSIPHIPGSRVGPKDYHISEGQAKIATEKTRDKQDVVIVQEKLDGSNVGVAKVSGEILAITRSGYLASSSPYKHHHYFETYVRQNFKRFNFLLDEGERVCGEWLAMAHGTIYKLPHEPFVPFDIMTGTKRINYFEFSHRVSDFDFTIPNLIHIGNSISVDKAIKYTSGHGATETPEGLVYRVERNGVIDFLCKYVHPCKIDGKYFNDKTTMGDIWNCDISIYKK